MAQVVLENAQCMFLQGNEPVLTGSGLIVPKRHRETVFDLTAEEWQATFDLLQRSKAWIDEQYAPEGYNVGWNCGAVGGQEVMHAHLHVIPRFEDEPLAGKGIRHWLKQGSNARSGQLIRQFWPNCSRFRSCNGWLDKGNDRVPAPTAAYVYNG
jgi:diadenosine tetraphosphate (Ap4A) HIT family hydrolase